MSNCMYGTFNATSLIRPKSNAEYFGIIQFIFSPVIVVVNMLLVYSFYATKQTLTSGSNFWIVCQSISDTLIGAIVMPLAGIRKMFLHSQEHCTLILTSFSLQIFLAGLSLCSTLLLAVDRYLHLNPDFQRSPSRLVKFFKPPKVYFLALICFLLNAAISIGYHFAVKTGQKLVFIFATYYTIVTTASMVLFIVMYIRGYLRIRNFVAENQVYANREGSNLQEPPEYLKKLFVTVLMILIVVFVSGLPNIILNLLFMIILDGEDDVAASTGFTVYREISFLLYYSNCFVNALIIIYRNDKSKQWLGKVLCLRRCSRNINEEVVPGNATVILNNGAIEP